MNRPYRRWTGLASALMLLAAGLCLAGSEVEEIGKRPVEVDFPAGGSLKLRLCSSGARIIGVDKNRVRVSYRATDNEDLSKVTVRLRTAGSEGTVEVERCPHDNFRIDIEVPRTLDLRVRMMAGQLDVEDVTGSKDLELSAGELNVELGRVEDYGSVDASVTTGEVDAPAYKVNKGGFFRSFERKGPGRYRFHAHVGAGQLSLR